MASSSDFPGLWRASANEGVPYSEDFPEPLLVLPELIDGSLGDGKATKITINLNITDPEKCKLTVYDNGKGIVDVKRLKDWTSKESVQDSAHHMYGHGTKKCLTKWMPDYEAAVWKLQWRTQDKKGCVSVLHILLSPFKGLETKHAQDDENDDICPIHGTQWELEFKLSILGRLNTAKLIMEALHEIIGTRYETTEYHPYIIELSVSDKTQTIIESSAIWKTLKECLNDEIARNTGNVIKTHDNNFTIGKSNVKWSKYQIESAGRDFNIPNFPTFGEKSMSASRVHIGIKGRYIEALSYAKFMGKTKHNSQNGIIMFVDFSGDELPTPCTTKVKFQEECPVYKKAMDEIRKELLIIKKKAAAPAQQQVASSAATSQPKQKKTKAQVPPVQKSKPQASLLANKPSTPTPVIVAATLSLLTQKPTAAATTAAAVSIRPTTPALALIKPPAPTTPAPKPLATQIQIAVPNVGIMAEIKPTATFNPAECLEVKVLLNKYGLLEFIRLVNEIK